MKIEEEIKILRYQAESDQRTGYPDLAKWRNQIADWLSDYQEVLDWMINIEPDVYDDYLRYVHG